MNLSSSLSSIKNAVPFGTVKFSDSANKDTIKSKGYYNVAVAWLKGATNKKSAENNEKVKNQFMRQLVSSFTEKVSMQSTVKRNGEKKQVTEHVSYCVLSQDTLKTISAKLKKRPWAPLSVRTAKSLIKLATKRANQGNKKEFINKALTKGEIRKAKFIKIFNLHKLLKPETVNKWVGVEMLDTKKKASKEEEVKDEGMNFKEVELDSPDPIQHTPKKLDEEMERMKDNVDYHKAEIGGELQSDEEREPQMDQPVQKEHKPSLSEHQQSFQKVIKQFQENYEPKEYN